MSNETRRILLVEDEKAIRDAVAAYLERENFFLFGETQKNIIAFFAYIMPMGYWQAIIIISKCLSPSPYFPLHNTFTTNQLPKAC